MAFTEAQRVKIRLYLGFPDVFRANDPRLEGAMDVIGARADTQAEVVACLAALVLAETKIATLLGSAGIKKVDEVEFFQAQSGGSAAVRDACSNARMWASRLSILMGVPLMGDAFGTRGYQGDSMFGSAVQASANIVPLG